MKNYVNFVNDHSRSMASGGKATAAKNDYNAMITAVKDAASKEMLDTVVSVVGVGIKNPRTGDDVMRQVTVSNPHVLKPIDTWPCPGGTPLYDGIGDMIALCEGLPDATDPNVSFLVQITTDGEEQHSRKETKASISSKISRLQYTGRWTFTARIPRGNRHLFNGLGIPDGNIVEWDNTAAGLAVATDQAKQAIGSFYQMRTAGATSSTVFYANAGAVDTSQLVDISSKVSLYVVDGIGVTDGIEIRDFILQKRAQYLKGAAFYQLTKSESRITEKKLVVVRDRSNGKIYGGQQARTMIGLPQFGNARLHPGDHKNYDIFIQSESVNRKLVKGTGVVYWEEKGVPFTEEELLKFLGKKLENFAIVPQKPAVVQLPSVPVSFRPTPSPIPMTKQVQVQGPMLNGKPIRILPKRDDARAQRGKEFSIDLKKHPDHAKVGVSANDRWAVYA